MGQFGLERALAQHRLALLATSPRVRRRVRDDQQGGALARQFRRRTVARSRRPHRSTGRRRRPDVDDRVGSDARVEVAQFVKDVVVRQQPLRRDRDDAVVAREPPGRWRYAAIRARRRPVAPRRGRRSRAPGPRRPDLRSRPCRPGPAARCPSSASSISATRDASMKPSFRSRSSGG